MLSTGPRVPDRNQCAPNVLGVRANRPTKLVRYEPYQAPDCQGPGNLQQLHEQELYLAV